MGKAARRARKARESAQPEVIPAPFVARPFAGLPGEADWVAMREIIPAATAQVRLRDVPPVRQALGGTSADGAAVTIVTLLPGAVPALRREDGELLVALQSGPATGDPSRDTAALILGMLAAAPGQLLASPRPATAATPRLQDILDLDHPFEARVHDSFAFWVPGSGDLEPAAAAQLEQASQAMVPTVRMTSVPAGASAFWCRIGERAHVRLLLSEDENDATTALARLHAAGQDTLGERTRLLGAFRASGLLIPVWDLDPAAAAADYEAALGDFSDRFTAALADPAALDADGRRARAGLLSRQLTLR